MTRPEAVQQLIACIANLTYRSPNDVYAEFASEAGPQYEYAHEQALVKLTVEQNKVIMEIIKEIHNLQRKIDD